MNKLTIRDKHYELMQCDAPSFIILQKEPYDLRHFELPGKSEEEFKTYQYECFRLDGKYWGYKLIPDKQLDHLYLLQDRWVFGPAQPNMAVIESNQDGFNRYTKRPFLNLTGTLYMQHYPAASRIIISNGFNTVYHGKVRSVEHFIDILSDIDI